MLDHYSISSKIIYNLLKEKGIVYLHHANTVATSISFIEQKSLLSRSFVAENGFFQTKQSSDNEDKTHDVWDHVFLDGEDLHKRYNRANKYGPVLFRIKLEMLTSPSIQSVFVTKSNPWYWKQNTSLENKFYSNVDELKKDYLTGKKLDSQVMFTFRNPNKEIKLNKYLHSIGLDKPKLLIKSHYEEEMSIGDYAEKAIKDSLESNGLGHIPILIRHNGNLNFCQCHADYNFLYNFNKQEIKKRFAKKK